MTANLQEMLGSKGIAIERFDIAEKGMKIRIDPETVIDIANGLSQNGFNFLTMLTAKCTENGFTLVYIFDNWGTGEEMWVYADAPKSLRVPSLTPCWPAADWLEREVYDMFGIEFEGHPNMIRILTPDGFDKFPLRKDFTDVD
jgi:NADH:ubiquinone oxidoreductase subunit C